MSKEKEKKYLLHLKNGTIHLTHSTCPHVKRMNEGNKKLFDNYNDAVHFFEGEKKGHPCGTCHPDREK